MIFFDHYPQIEAFDTETYKGTLKLICNSKECFEPKDDSIELLEWLFEHSSPDLNFFYNISFDFSVIVKPYIQKMTKKQLQSGKDIIIGKYKISYINNKAFTITDTSTRRGEHYIRRFFDISGFYKEGTANRTLDDVAKSELGTGKNNEDLGIDRKSIGEKKGYYELHRDKIKRYCMQDAVLTQRLSERRVNTVFALLKAIPKNWYSNASISKSYMKLNHPEESYAFPKLIKSLPVNEQYNAFELIRNSYYGGLFWDKSLGNIGKASELDINSAYPYNISNLKSIVGAKIIRVSDYDPKADYSFYRIRLKYPKDFPFPYRQKTHGQYMILYPFSTDYIETFTTGAEIEYLQKKNVDFKIIEGYAIYCQSNESAFSDFRELYNLRQQYKKQGNNALQYMIKIILNATYGTTAQQNGGYSQFTNFVYSSYITALTRVKIYEMCDKIGWENVKSIKTDAIIYTGTFKHNSNNLGDYKLEFENEEVITYMTGLSIRNGKIDAKRGFSNLKSEDLLNAEGDKYILPDKERPIKLKEGIAQNRKKDIGRFKVSERTLHLKSNIGKYVIDTDRLRFEVMNKKEISTNPIMVSENSALKREMKDEYHKVMKIAENYKNKKVVLKPLTQDITIEQIFKMVQSAETYRDREKAKRKLLSNKGFDALNTLIENMIDSFINVLSTFTIA